MTMRAWRLGALLVGGALAVVACGIDESGLASGDASLPSDASTPNDVQTIDVVEDVPLPPTCSTTETGCFGLGDGGLPDGWSAYLYVPDGGACPSVAYAPQPLVTNTQLTGGCVCACVGEGSWSCPATLDVTGGNGVACNNTSVAVDGGCQDVSAFHLAQIQQTQVATATGNGLGCDGGAPSSPVVAWNDVTLCAAGCDAGASAVCGAPSGTRACIAAQGVQTCPGNLDQVIVGGSADPSCNGCSCATDSIPPTCTAVAHLYWNPGAGSDTNCTDAGGTQDLVLTSSCQTTAHSYDSYDFTWEDAGPVTCSSGGGGGDAGLSTPKTLCCLP